MKKLKEKYLSTDISSRRLKLFAFSNYFFCGLVFFGVSASGFLYYQQGYPAIAKLVPFIGVWCLLQIVLINYFYKANNVAYYVRESFSFLLLGGNVFCLLTVMNVALNNA